MLFRDTQCPRVRRALLAFLPALLLAAGPLPARAADETEKGECWAILIGIEKYHRASQLRYTVNDVRQLSATLRQRGEYAEERILEMTDAATNPRYQPLKTSLQAELPAWLEKPGPHDSILVYFSGHGFRDNDGKLYLAPIDCNPEQPADTGIPVQWFREQIAGCQAQFKLLILDACHAGSEKGDDKEGISGAELGDPFKDLAGVVTIASSTADEKSQIWEERQQSLFSYWLLQALSGHADANSDSQVDIDELYKFVYRRVTQSAKARFPRSQTPVRIVRTGTHDVPVVIQLRPQTLGGLLAATAEQLANTMQEKTLDKVGVLEFTNDTKLGELLGADFGLLGRYCAEELERQLIEQSAETFSVVSRRRLQAALKDADFGIDDLGNPDAMSKLSEKASGMPVIALGTLRNRAGRVVTIQCQMLGTETGDALGSAGGTALLNESEWAMLGRSAAVQVADRRPVVADDPNEIVPIENQVVEKLDKRAAGPHPLQDPAFPYRVSLRIGGRERTPIFRGNDCFLSVRKGEVYELRVENRSDQPVVMRLLVDGLNTLPEKEQTKGVATYIVGKRVNLDEARYWILDPQKPYAVRGFVSEAGAAGRLREFQVVDADDSLAARQKFTDQIGLITAAFYVEGSGSRAVGTGLGRERDERFEQRKGTQAGNLLAVVHLRYVDADEADLNPR